MRAQHVTARAGVCLRASTDSGSCVFENIALDGHRLIPCGSQFASQQVCLRPPASVRCGAVIAHAKGAHSKKRFVRESGVQPRRGRFERFGRSVSHARGVGFFQPISHDNRPYRGFIVRF